jgi:hypothetical protein
MHLTAFLSCEPCGNSIIIPMDFHLTQSFRSAYTILHHLHIRLTRPILSRNANLPI